MVSARKTTGRFAKNKKSVQSIKNVNENREAGNVIEIVEDVEMVEEEVQRIKSGRLLKNTKKPKTVATTDIAVQQIVEVLVDADTVEVKAKPKFFGRNAKKGKMPKKTATKDKGQVRPIVDGTTFSAVQGLGCQSDQRFGNSSGVQCTAIAVFACAYSHAVPVIDWQPNTVGTLLDNGDALYNVTFAQLTTERKSETRYLSAEEVQGTIWADGKAFKITHTPFFASDESPFITGANISEAMLDRFFARFACGVSTSSGLSIALLRFVDDAGTQCYGIFDSHSIDRFGKYVANGRATLFTFTSLASFFAFLKGRIQNDGAQIDLIGCDFELLTSSASASVANKKSRNSSVNDISGAVHIEPARIVVNSVVPSLSPTPVPQSGRSSVASPPRKFPTPLARKKAVPKKSPKPTRVSLSRKAKSDALASKAEAELRDRQQKEKAAAEAAAKRDERTMLLAEQRDLERLMAIAKANAKEKNATARRAKQVARQQLVATFQLARCLDDAIEEDKIETHSLGPFDRNCKHCDAYLFKCELRAGLVTPCCNDGSIKIDLPRPYPKLLRDLLTGFDIDSKHFRENTRRYNNKFSFATFAAKIDPPQPKGPPFVKVQGQIAHTIHHYYRNGKMGQMYMLDSVADATALRLSDQYGQGLRARVLGELHELLVEINPLTAMFKILMDVETAANNSNNGPRVDIHLEILHDRSEARRPADLSGAYNVPTCNEVCVVYDTEQNSCRNNIRLYPTNIGHKPLDIKCINPNVDPLTYPVLFPFGEQTFRLGIAKKPKSKTNKNAQSDVTCREYYNFLLRPRHSFSALLHASKLTQQYAIDCFVKIETNILEFYKSPTMQVKFRVETLCGLRDFVRSTDSHEEGVRPGKAVILPETYSNSARSNVLNYQNSMLLCGQYGKPDFFITFTCNPKWSEIAENLKFGETAYDRPDLVARVFRLKLAAFFDDLFKKHVLGRVRAYVATIEYQKRGMPHCHLLMFMLPSDRVVNGETIDEYVSAEIPNEKTHPRLYEIFTRHMLHGPCNGRPCWNAETQKCAKRFPFAFREETSVENGYAVLRRRDNGVFCKKGNSIFTNEHTVSTNMYLLLRFNCHINVEICSSINSVKYIFKYIHKGPDRAMVEKTVTTTTNKSRDEIKTHIDSRYVCAQESMDRINGEPDHFMSHATKVLAIHLPDQQQVRFAQDALIDDEFVNLSRHSTLTKFFELNRNDPNARRFLYTEIPLHYVIDEKTKDWKPRQLTIKPILGRIAGINIRNVELFSLKLILQHFTGQQSYEDCRRVKGILYETFQEAAVATGLRKSDRVWYLTMDEVVKVEVPYRLRLLFATILVFGHVAASMQLWEAYKSDLSEDYRRKGLNASDSEQMALWDINHMLQRQGTNNLTVNIPPPPSDSFATVRRSREYINAQIDLQAEESEAQRMLAMLNPAQQDAFNRIMAAVNDDQAVDRCFFVDGPGGSGKTFLYCCLLATLRGKGEQPIPMAWTGIAAALMKGGRTVHAWFKFSLGDNLRSHLKGTAAEAVKLRNAKIIIWDEITLTPASALDGVDAALRDITGKVNVPFGGKVILVGGDFRQCLPIVRQGMKTDILNACVSRAKTWFLFKRFELTVNQRLTAGQQSFARWQLDIGEGRINDRHCNVPHAQYVRIPDNCVTHIAIAEQVFGEEVRSDDLVRLTKFVVLTPLNEDVNAINNQILDRIVELKSTLREYLSADNLTDEATDEARDFFPQHYLNSLNPPGLPQHKIRLKVNVPIMLLRNLDLSRGLCNGTRLTVLQLNDNTIIARIIAGPNSGQVVIIPKLHLTSIGDGSRPFIMDRFQFPVRLCFAMTINKSQGQTFDRVGVYFRRPPFAHGQLYVAISRVRSENGLALEVEEFRHMGMVDPGSDDIFVPNVVFPEVFQ